MSKFYYLGTCDTCQRIMNDLSLPEDIKKREIKSVPLSEKELETLHAMAGSYEALFSKRSRLYKERNLKEANLQESDFKALLMEHYTFLKRPVLVHNGSIFIGNSKKNVEAAYSALHHS